MDRLDPINSIWLETFGPRVGASYNPDPAVPSRYGSDGGGRDETCRREELGRCSCVRGLLRECIKRRRDLIFEPGARRKSQEGHMVST